MSITQGKARGMVVSVEIGANGRMPCLLLLGLRGHPRRDGATSQCGAASLPRCSLDQREGMARSPSILSDRRTIYRRRVARDQIPIALAAPPPHYLSPRFRALALFNRRPLERRQNPSLPAVENLRKRRHNAVQQTLGQEINGSAGGLMVQAAFRYSL